MSLRTETTTIYVAVQTVRVQSVRKRRTPGATRMVFVVLGALLVLRALPADASVEPSADDSEEPLYAAPSRLDRIGRILAAVHVNQQGPYRFIVDTGSNRSAVSTRLVESLGLVSEDNALIKVHGVTGSAAMPAVRLQNLQAGDLVLHDQNVPVLAAALFADADGILGIDGLQSMRIEVDFVLDRVTIRRSRGKRAPDGYLTVPAQFEHGGLLRVRGKVGKVRAAVIIDTGAQNTIGNLALQEALGRTMNAVERSEATVSGATPIKSSGFTLMAPLISIGEARLRNLPVTFADLHVFKLWGLTDEPALVVGMDILGTLEQLVVDYARREFQLKPYSEGGVSYRSCNSGECGTRLPKRGS
jgi:predicted aspartyl protease